MLQRSSVSTAVSGVARSLLLFFVARRAIFPARWMKEDGMAKRSRRSRSLPEGASVHAPDQAHRNGQLLAAEAEEMALRLECAKLAGEELPLRLAYERYLDLVHRAISFEHGTLYVTEWTSGRLLPVAVRGNRVELADRIRFGRGSGLSALGGEEGRAGGIPEPGSNGNRPPFSDARLRAF